MENSWEQFSGQIDNSFFFVVDKIIALLSFFIAQARHIGWVVLLIAILTAALNYALTGQGLKENVIKITKATLFFLITIVFYPNIISHISRWTFNLAQDSVEPSIRNHFENIRTEMDIVVNSGAGSSTFQDLKRNVYVRDAQALAIFSNISKTRTAYTGTTSNSGRITYTAFAPAAVVQVMFLLSKECFKLADKKPPGYNPMPDVGNILKGLICAFFIILTGVFAILEYLICFLEFLLVATVGIILFPLSIWEGSKFLSEKFIGALVGFFMKLLFCCISVFLLLYGFCSMLSIFNASGFKATPDQMIFIIFVCLLFFYICKSAPGIAQSLLTGTPSLSATGAISAATGAVAAAAAVHNTVGKVASKTENALVGGAASAAKSVAAFKAGNAQGGIGSGIGAAFKSIAGDVGSSAGKGAVGLTRSLLGLQGGIAGSKTEADINKTMTLQERFSNSMQSGAASVKQRGIIHSSTGQSQQNPSNVPVTANPSYSGAGAGVGAAPAASGSTSGGAAGGSGNNA